MERDCRLLVESNVPRLCPLVAGKLLQLVPSKGEARRGKGIKRCARESLQSGWGSLAMEAPAFVDY